MRYPKLRHPVIQCAVLALCACAFPAHAALGEYESSVASDATTARMVLRPANTADIRIRVYPMRDEQRGIRVREYANSQDGRIFGIAWDGPVKPDLRLLLGPQYFGRYVEAAKRSGKIRGVREIREGSVAVRVAGHMRHFVGAAWIPALLPKGMDPADIR